jgi:hypothetical protein
MAALASSSSMAQPVWAKPMSMVIILADISILLHEYYRYAAPQFGAAYLQSMDVQAAAAAVVGHTKHGALGAAAEDRVTFYAFLLSPPLPPVYFKHSHRIYPYLHPQTGRILILF